MIKNRKIYIVERPTIYYKDKEISPNINMKKRRMKMNKNLLKGIIIGAALGMYSGGAYHNTKQLSRELEPVREEFREIIQNVEPKIKSEFNIGTGREMQTYDYGGKLDDIVNTVKQYGKDNGAIYFGGWGAEKGPYDEQIVPKNLKSPVALNPLKWGSINKASIEHFLNEDTNQYK